MLNFNFNAIETTEFGVGFDTSDTQEYYCIAVDGDVQDALRDMAITTWDNMQQLSPNPIIYDPSDKHSGLDYMYLPLEDELAQDLRDFHNAVNIEIDNNAIDYTDEIYCYYARFTDTKGNHLTALRRASYFKGMLGKRLIFFGSDAMNLVEGDIFKLDNDFDLLIDSKRIHIFRPSSFEFMGNLTTAILASVPQNIEKISENLTYIDFTSIENYAMDHPRAARYLASIKTHRETVGIDKNALCDLCHRTKVEVNNDGDVLSIDDNHIMGFLEVLDRRRYEINLVTDSPEQYRAPSRQRIS